LRYQDSGEAMAQILARNLADEVKLKLERRAKRHGRSMEEEMREILRDAAKKEVRSRKGLGSEIAALFRRSGLAAGEEIAEFHGTKIQPVDFAE
jgi:plasmid stability protein